MSNNKNQLSKLRDALGEFATGICVMTTIDKSGSPIGMTANSFSSVSLQPPLVLWCIGRESARFQEFSQTDYYTVNVLTQDQADVSTLFATRLMDDDLFNEVEWHMGQKKIPQLSDCQTRFQCKVVDRHKGGDHLILVGEVFEFDSESTQPLVFFQGAYQQLK